MITNPSTRISSAMMKHYLCLIGLGEFPWKFRVVVRCVKVLCQSKMDTSTVTITKRNTEKIEARRNSTYVVQSGRESPRRLTKGETKNQNQKSEKEVKKMGGEMDGKPDGKSDGSR